MSGRGWKLRLGGMSSTFVSTSLLGAAAAAVEHASERVRRAVAAHTAAADAAVVANQRESAAREEVITAQRKLGEAMSQMRSVECGNTTSPANIVDFAAENVPASDAPAPLVVDVEKFLAEEEPPRAPDPPDERTETRPIGGPP